MSVILATSQLTLQTRRAPVQVETIPGLTSESLTLRPLGYSDQAAFIEALNRSRLPLRRWIPLENTGESPSDYFHHQLQKTIQGDQTGTACRRAIFLNDNTFAGMVNIIKIERGLEWTAEANWWIDSALSGQGLATQALEILLDHAMTDMPVGLGLHQVRAMICLDNPGSVRIAEKLGFKNTGHTDLLKINHALITHHEFTRSA